MLPASASATGYGCAGMGPVLGATVQQPAAIDLQPRPWNLHLCL